LKNTLYYGDNLEVLRQYIKDETVDLIYLDPPFNSNANYNVLFAEQDGTRAAAQIQAFQDTWQWDQAAADGPAAGGAAPGAQTYRQPVPALRSNGQPLLENRFGCHFWNPILSKRNYLETDELA